MKKFLIGPKLGDFLQTLYVVKCLSDGEKSDVYITKKFVFNEFGDAFSRGLENTYEDIYPFIKNLPYVNDFFIYDHDNEIEDIIDLRTWYRCDKLYNANWYDIFDMYNTGDKYEKEKWLYEFNDPNYESYRDTVIISFGYDYFGDRYVDSL